MTIDLNGFRIDGGGVARTGIVGQQRNLTVRNGTVRKFLSAGISNNGAGLLVDSMRIQENTGGGVYDGGPASAYGEIRGSSILGNGGFTAVQCSPGCVVRDSNVSRNAGSGVTFAENTGSGMVLGSAILANGQVGLNGRGGDAVGNSLLSANQAGPEISVQSQGTNVCDRARC